MSFFVLSKIFWAIFAPLTFTSLIIVVGAVLGKWRIGKALLTLGIFLLVFIGTFPVGKDMLVYLESRHPAPVDLPSKIDGIIVLGGSFDMHVSYVREQPQLNNDGARIIEFVKLSRIYPQAKLVFSGGSGALDKSTRTESEIARRLFDSVGVDTKRITFENKSRNTYENMVRSKEKINPQAGEKWLLVTSAYHMPRAAAIFKTGGWDVIPYPAGYLTDGEYFYAPSYKVLEGFFQFQVAMKELIGIMVYDFTGKINGDVFGQENNVTAVRDSVSDDAVSEPR